MSEVNGGGPPAVGLMLSTTFFISCRLAMIVTFWGELTGAVLIGNVALLAPPGMTTEAGTGARSGLLLASVTTNPPEGALHPGISATVP